MRKQRISLCRHEQAHKGLSFIRERGIHKTLLHTLDSKLNSSFSFRELLILHDSANT